MFFETPGDYYPFGMVMPMNNSSVALPSAPYRFGYNGQENDEEICGTGNAMSAEFWEYDSRLARRWNGDPVVDASVSSYACFNDNPIAFNDPCGDEAGTTNSGTPSNQTPAGYNGPDIVITAPKVTLKERVQRFLLAAKVVVSEVKKEAQEFGIGVATSVAINNDPNVIRGIAATAVIDKLLLNKPNTKLFYAGRVTGDVVSFGMGVAEMIEGTAAEGGGVASSETGVGLLLIPAGAELQVIGVKTSGFSAISVVKDFHILQMAKDVHDEAHNSKSTNGSSDPSSGSDPVYENPGTHDPNSPNYNSTKETIPDNAEELFNANKKNVEPDGRTIWAKEGNGKKAVYHRFQGSNGKWHWNGSTAGGKRQIPMDKVPVDVKRR